MAQCYRCNKVEVSEEFERCPECTETHKKLCEELDRRPKIVVEKVKKEELFPIIEVKQGIKVTTYISREDAYNMGIKLPQ